MKRNPAFLIHQTGKDTILLPTSGTAFSGVVKGNRTFGAILELLTDDMTEQELISALREKFDAPEGVVEQDVVTALENLRKIGALYE